MPVTTVGITNLNLKQYDKAIADFSQAIEIDSDYARAYNNRGVLYKDIKQYDKAIDDYSHAIEIDPKNPTAWYSRGNAYNDLHQYDNAVADYSRAIEIDPKDTDAYNSRGIAYRNIQQYDRAISDFSKALEIDPKYTYAYNGLGRTFYDLQQYEKSIANYTRLIELDTGNIDGYLGLSIVYSGKNNYDSAIILMNQGILQNPHEAILYDAIGKFYFEKADNEDAGSNFKKCLEIDDKNFDAALGLAAVFYSNSDLVNAKTYLDKARVLEPRLYKGMDGIAELEKEGYVYLDKRKATLNKMFGELK